LTIPTSAINHTSADSLALLWWSGVPFAQAFIALAALGLAAAFLLAPPHRRTALTGGVLTVVAATLLAGLVQALKDDYPYRSTAAAGSWIDEAVGPDAKVVAVWYSPSHGNSAHLVHELWADEFFNRSVRRVASAQGVLADGLPVVRLTFGPRGCLTAARGFSAGYAAVGPNLRLQDPVVARSAATRTKLYRLQAPGRSRCLARFAKVVG
jgi:hypothetical protein